MNGNKEVINHGGAKLLLGDNVFASGIVSLGNGKTLKDGALLTVEASGKFAVATVAGANCAVYVGDEIVNHGASAADIPVRACIGGKLRRDAVLVGDAAIEAKAALSLRSSGLFLLEVQDIGKQDNQ